MTKRDKDRIAELTRQVDEEYRALTGGLFDLDWDTQNAINRGADPVRLRVFNETMAKFAGRPGLRAHMIPEAIRMVEEYDGPVILGQHEDAPMRDRDGNPIVAAPCEPLDFGGEPLPSDVFDMVEMLPAFDGEFATIMSDPRDPKDAGMEELIAEGWRFANDRGSFPTIAPEAYEYYGDIPEEEITAHSARMAETYGFGTDRWTDIQSDSVRKVAFAPQAMAYYGDIPDEVIAEAKRKEREREARDAEDGVVWEHVDGIRFADEEPL
ncbi:hypothetical protein [Paenirhodobacter populi]|uniref:Uncharacterized protein n=1 Tax=Paenirhodobacter populi TaxID=2306993 RepID=A0A443J010_9RHOB|nr:hypothetical protein [Sinirhodobacter populi]RWR13801.1 hypothetical protein D2T33_05225 [Sinirhodobacter populi]